MGYRGEMESRDVGPGEGRAEGAQKSGRSQMVALLNLPPTYLPVTLTGAHWGRLAGAQWLSVMVASQVSHS